jgi:hypothetical protein
MVATGLGLSSWLVDCRVAAVLEERFGFLCFAILVVGRLGVGAFVVAALRRGDDANDAGRRLGGSGSMSTSMTAQRRLSGAVVVAGAKDLASTGTRGCCCCCCWC